jgi:hypothetical protein
MPKKSYGSKKGEFKHGHRWRNFRMRILTTDGLKTLRIGNENDASNVGEYWNAIAKAWVWKEGAEGDTFDLELFEGDSLRSEGQVYYFETRLEYIKDFFTVVNMNLWRNYSHTSRKRNGDSKYMTDNDLKFDRAMRQAGKTQRLNVGYCVLCGYSDTRALQSVKITLCAECRLILQGNKPVEWHHLFGRHYPITLPLPANEHAILSDMAIENKPDGDSPDLESLYGFKNMLERLLEITDQEIAKQEGS